MQDRAYSFIETKSIDEKRRIFKGLATSPVVDRVGDTIDPLGASFKNPLPLLHQHRRDAPIGTVTFANPTSKGIEFEAEIPVIKEPGPLKDRVDTAWGEIKHGLVRAVSIGFKPMKYAFRDDGGIDFQEIEIFELSSVTVPANSEATIQTIKSIDAELRAASGQTQSRRIDPSPGVTGTPTKPASRGFFFARNKGNDVKTIQEQIAALEAARAAKAARMQEIMQKSIAEGRSTEADEQEEFDNLAAEVKTADDDLVRLRTLERLNVAKAAPVSQVQPASDRPVGPTIILPKSDPDEKFVGQNFTRKTIAKALAYLSQGEMSVSEVAEQRWGKSYPQLVQVIKANVAGGGSGSGEWGAELVQADTRYTGDFIEFLNGRTVFNQLPLREVPAHVTIKGQDGIGTGYWVGESKPIAPSAQDFSSVTLSPLKVAAMSVVSEELLRDSSPAAEMLVRDGLIAAIASKVDTTFLSTASAGAGVSPAGLLNGLLAIGSYGATADDLRGDIKNLYAGFIAAKNATGLYYVMSPSLAKQIQLMRNALGQREFEGITATGGTLEGDPVVVGDNVNATHLILLKPSDIYKIGDGGVQVSISREATIEMADDPTGASDTPAAASKMPVNMFQSNSVAIKVVRSMNFAKRRASAVAYVDDAAYGSYTT